MISLSSPVFYSFFFILWWAKPVVNDFSNHLKKQKTEGWSPLYGQTWIPDEENCVNANQMRVFSPAWVHCTAAFFFFFMDGGFARYVIQSKQTVMGQKLGFVQGSFVSISVASLTLHDQKSGCLMFYQRQLGGCLCMCLPNCGCIRGREIFTSLWKCLCAYVST